MMLRRRLSIVRSVGSAEVIEVLPFGQFLVQVHIVNIGHQLIELFLVGPVRTFDLAVQLRRSRFDADVPNAIVLDVPVKLRLSFCPRSVRTLWMRKGNFSTYSGGICLGWLLAIRFLRINPLFPSTRSVFFRL
jgi:hypothetical protein